MIQFILNQQNIQTELPSGTTVLDFVRYQQHLRGTKIGCREGDCGACTILVGQFINGQLEYRSMTSCLMPLGNAHGKHIVTIEGINLSQLTPVQQAILDEGGTQCGFCTIGFVLSFTGFALSDTEQGYEGAIAAIDGNICRCTGYKSLERAADRISKELAEKDQNTLIPWLVEQQYLPAYFLEIEDRLQKLKEDLPILEKKTKQEIIGGGTDLLVQRPEEITQTSMTHFFDQSHLHFIEQRDHQLHIGASVTAEDLRSSALFQSYFPAIRAHMKLVSSTPIRNMGTLAGNLVNASPIGDLTIFFLALGSHLLIRKGEETRTVPLNQFYKAYKAFDLLPEEKVEALYFDLPSPHVHFNFEKVCKRTHLDIASVNSACWLEVNAGEIQTIRLSAGGVAAIPKALKETADFLTGKKITTEIIKEAALVLQKEVSPISDARGSADYKRLLLRQLFFAHFIKFFPQRFTLKALTHDA